MMAQIETEVIPVWFIERWLKENAEEESALDYFVKQMLQEWKVEEYLRTVQTAKGRRSKMATCPDITLNYLWELIEGKSNDEWCDQVPIWVLRNAFESLIQEPVKIKVKKINDSGRCGQCPSCLIELNETDYPNYCGCCGREVKWDG